MVVVSRQHIVSQKLDEQRQRARSSDCFTPEQLEHEYRRPADTLQKLHRGISRRFGPVPPIVVGGEYSLGWCAGSYYAFHLPTELRLDTGEFTLNELSLLLHQQRNCSTGRSWQTHGIRGHHLNKGDTYMALVTCSPPRSWSAPRGCKHGSFGGPVRDCDCFRRRGSPSHW